MKTTLFDLTGRVALVTGAGQGLGRGFALALAAGGATVVCIGRTGKNIAETVALIHQEKGDALALNGDVTDGGSIKNQMDTVMDRFGRIDILVNNAGTEIAEPFFEVTPDHFDTIMAVNLKGAYLVAQAAARYMAQAQRGKIINIASLGSYIGLSGSSVYCSSKGAVLQLTKALAVELAPFDIQVNAIAPGYFRTPMTEPFFQDPKHSQWIRERIPLGRVGTAADLAGPVVFLASAASDYMTGQAVIIDGGWLAS